VLPLAGRSPNIISKGEIMESMNPSPSGAERSGIQDAAERASAAAHSTVDQVAGAARPAIDRLAAGAHQTVDKLAGAASTAARVAEEKSEKMKLAQERLLEDCRGYVRDNPMTALGIAVAVGFVLSRLTSSR
jgi:ElaB/YqjD/DUF883 family membrane-anchored ribosome-binding protein